MSLEQEKANFVKLRESIDNQRAALGKLNRALINLGQAMESFMTVLPGNSKLH